MKYGKLAFEYCGKKLPLRVMKSNAGWYIGTCSEDGPCSRESEYFAVETEAHFALAANHFKQRTNP